MNPETITVLVWLILKILTLIGLGLYAVFALVIVRQEQLMAAVLEEEFEPVLRFLTFVHLVAALGLFFLAIILL